VFQFPSCNLLGEADFNEFNMSYFARLYLIDLDLNGTRVVGDNPFCQNMFTDLCYLHMWVQNVRSGFLCAGNDNQTYRGGSVSPPCRSFCWAVLTSSCSEFANAVLRPGETVAQYCEVFPADVRGFPFSPCLDRLTNSSFSPPPPPRHEPELCERDKHPTPQWICHPGPGFHLHHLQVTPHLSVFASLCFALCVVVRYPPPPPPLPPPPLPF